MTARHRRRAFGTISRLPSGRFRARYTGPDGARYSAPATFDTRAQAEAWLVTARAEVIRGRTPIPEGARLTLAAYLPAFLTQRAAELRPSTLGL